MKLEFHYTPKHASWLTMVEIKLSVFDRRLKASIFIFIALTCHLRYLICMEFPELVDIVGDEPVFDTGLLLAGDANPREVRRQLSRWKQTGKIIQLRRGLYCLAPPFQKVNPHPYLVANRLIPASYVSLQSALAHYA